MAWLACPLAPGSKHASLRCVNWEHIYLLNMTLFLQQVLEYLNTRGKQFVQMLGNDDTSKVDIVTTPQIVSNTVTLESTSHTGREA